MKPVLTRHTSRAATKHAPTRIYLTGFMGCGKSTVGQLLAEKLGYHFFDLDTEIEKVAGCSIPALFETQGEAAFRALEATQLRTTEACTQAVMALGGGTLTFEENLRWALANGTVVYLEAPMDVLLERLLTEYAGRPMLYDAHGHRQTTETLRTQVAGLLAKRTPFYRRAHHTVDASLPAEEVAAAIAQVV